MRKDDNGQNAMIPSFPTDNLYKLITIMGLALIIASTYLFGPFGHSVIPDIRKGAADALILHHRLKAAGLAPSPLPEKLGTVEPADLYEANDALIQSLSHDAPGYAELRKMNEDLLLERTRQWSLDAERRVNQETFHVGWYSGSAMFILGLVFWFLNFQRHQDRLSIEQLKSAMYETKLKEWDLFERTSGADKREGHASTPSSPNDTALYS
ncbi:hypothetical protein DXT98_01090 [Agrobacterium sp. ICMP 7243]|nr:hypothetical protein DXT98_01090 [Agrobacterium sp. ICMP 7243]